MTHMVQPQDQPTEYSTSDLALAAYLAYWDFYPTRMQNGDGRRMLFVYPIAAEKIAARFWQPGGDMVSAKKFHYLLKEMRRLTQPGGPR